MKIKHTIAILLLAGSAVFTACKPQPKGELGDVANKVKGMNGTWELVHFIQQDPNNPVLEERDMSELYIADGVTPMHLTLNNADLTFSIENTMGKNYFGTSGTWALDDVIAPSSVTLFGTTDTLVLNLGAIVLPTSNELSLEYERVCSDGFKNVIYKYTFSRVQ